MRRRMLNLLTALSLLLCVAVAACWSAGAVGERQVRAWRVWSTPARTWFVRLDRQHLIVSDQQMVPVAMPDGYALDTSNFRAFRVEGPVFPRGAGTELSPEYFALNPTGAWFRKIRLGTGGIRVNDDRGAVAWRVNAVYGAVEVPWWTLLVASSVLPAARWFSRRRARTRRRRGLCHACGYDLRASPDRCPECGSAASGVFTP